MPSQNPLKKKEKVLQALEESLGVVTTACLKAGISRQLFYQWKKEDKQFADKVLDIEDIALDFAESKLHSQISSNNITATIFFLKTRGKKRGYVEAQEIGMTNINKSPSWFEVDE